ncbi:MAG: alanine racemase [Deltaproteobacteria bacterium]|nr:MAG: alanine racemase [Deltaproteobacteria bacterium]
MRPTLAEIDLDALGFNFEQVKRLTGSAKKILAMVKADAYGHGAIAVSRELEGLGVDFFGVALCQEGIELRKAGITAPILVLSGFFKGDEAEIVRHRLTPLIFNLEMAERLARQAKNSGQEIGVHIKVDSGMGRVGVLPEEAGGFFRGLKKLGGLKVEGICSHFAEADKEEKDFTREQQSRFSEVVSQAKKSGFTPLTHLANSAAIIDFPPAHYDLVRPGIMLYGAYPSPVFRKKTELRPVMRLKTRILHLKRVPPGFSISYGRTFFTECESLIATLPIGYADGYSRGLSNKGEALIKGRRCKVVGRVCMDLTMIDVTDVPGVKIDDEVVLLGRQGAEEIEAQDIAGKIGTVPYEVFCSVSKRVPRVYMKMQNAK